MSFKVLPETHTSSNHDAAESGDLAAVAAAASAGSNTEVPFADHVHAHGSGYLPNAHHNQSHSVSDHTTAVNVNDEGVSQGAALTFDFVGSSVTAAVAGGVATITVSGGGHAIEDEGVALTQRATMNFVGAGVTATDAGGKTVVTIPGGGGSSDEPIASSWLGL